MSELREMLQADVLTLGMAADRARRDSRPGNVVTYLRVHTVTPADVSGRAAVPEAAAEVRLYETPAALDEAVAQVRGLRELAGTRRVAAFSMAEIETRGWGPLPEVLRALAAAGLDDVAELPVDQVPDLPASLAALVAAGFQPQRLTVSQPPGERRLEVIERARQAMAGHSSIRRFAPLARRAPADKPTTGYDDVRMVALARLALGAASIEVDWSIYGPKLAQVALTFGADHLDAVAAVDDTALGARRTALEDAERNIRAAGFEPKPSHAA